ncbi:MULTISPECIES: signal peptidase II [Bacillus cereus group]|uniref:signal peptidase II n=1 Tax=Bacillus cereus group TaxID=86661 RepID=UPI001C024315|nr:MULTISPECIES: signal peptidase II [Bacillus cereus group]MDM5462995.1 signal peptidase II [Bacillus cereus]QWH38017.1 signal peptidase II [Bacillus mycoides]QWI50076.1 signal peptidase II [Bacillus mycoides]WJE18120.1 signal peptidase II [Bacillus cereus]
MVNKKRYMKVKFWSVRALIILFFAVSAITVSQGVVHLQGIVKERFFSEKKSTEIYKETINSGNIEDYGTPIEDKKVGDNGKRTTTGKKFKGFERENSWGDVFSVLSNSWITVAFSVIIAVAIIYYFYKYVRKRLTKTEIEQEKQSITKENSVRTVKNETVSHQLVRPLPTDPIRKRLIEWERTLQLHEQRRSYETIQQWLKRICRTRDIIPIYESVRYGEKICSELDVEKTMRWINQDEKVEE